MIWVSLVLATGLMRLALFLRYRRAMPPENRVPIWERTFFILTMLYFLSWGIGGLWIMPTDSLVHQVVILYFLIGLAGSAVAVFSANRVLLLGAISALLLPMLFWLFSKTDTLSIGLGLAGAAFLVSAVRSSRILSSAMRQNLRLNHQLVKAKAAAEQLARVDELTGLYNRRAFYEYGGLLVTQSQRAQSPMSVIILDLDFFKQINDDYGHHAGDRVLRHVSGTIVSGLRETDVCGRVGGEEFAILLPGTTLAPAIAVAEKLRMLLAQTPITVGDKKLKVTASMGVAEGNEGLEAMLNIADSSLYEAKEAGRNRVAHHLPAIAAETCCL